MTPELIHLFFISTAFIAAIVNDDRTSLNDEDDQLLDNWYSTLGKNDYPVIEPDQEPQWQVCQISRYYANCVKVKIFRNHQ